MAVLGDPVAPLEVGGLGVERGDRRQRVGQVVEHEDEVGLDEGGRRHADRIAVRQRHPRLEHGDRVVGERTDRATGEPRHPLGRLDPSSWDERADGVERIRSLARLDREVGRRRRHRDGPGLDAGHAVADLEQAARADPEERVSTEALAALDRFEQVGGSAVIEAQEGTDRRLEVGRAGGAQEDRVGVGGVALGLGQADGVRGGHRRASRIKNDRSSPGRKVVPSAVPPSFGVAALS